MPGSLLVLKPLPPFSLGLTVWALRRSPHNEVDRWDGRTYSRIFVLHGTAVKVTVSQAGTPGRSELHLTVDAENGVPGSVQAEISATIGRILSLQVDLTGFYAFAEGNDLLRPLVRQFTGMKPPRFAAIFEALVNAVSCQQVTLDLGIALLNRLARAHGRAFREGDTVLHAFPLPEDLARLVPDDFRQLGYSRSKGRAIIGLAQEALRGTIDQGVLERMDDAAAAASLSRLRGIGRWSAEYVLLRGLGRTHLFPTGDVGAQRSLRSFLGLAADSDIEQLARVTSGWQPYAGLIYFHFLLGKLKRRGYL